MGLSLGPDSVLLPFLLPPFPSRFFFFFSFFFFFLLLLAFFSPQPPLTGNEISQCVNGRGGGRPQDKEEALSGGEFR